MAVVLEFIDFIVPIEVIRKKYPGGWEQCLKDHDCLMGGSGRVWHDEHLLRDGAMNPADIAGLIDEWTKLGFEPYVVQGEREVWKDCCVVEGMFGGPTLPCDWLEISEDGRSAYLKGQPSGDIVGRHQNVRAQ